MANSQLTGVGALLARTLYTPGSDAAADAFIRFMFPSGASGASGAGAASEKVILQHLTSIATATPTDVTSFCDLLRAPTGPIGDRFGAACITFDTTVIVPSRAAYSELIQQPNPDIRSLVSNVIGLITFADPSMSAAVGRIIGNTAQRLVDQLNAARRVFTAKAPMLSKKVHELQLAPLDKCRCMMLQLEAIAAVRAAFLETNLDIYPLMIALDSRINGRRVSANDPAYVAIKLATPPDSATAFSYSTVAAIGVDGVVSETLGRVRVLMQGSVYAPMMAARIWTLTGIIAGAPAMVVTPALPLSSPMSQLDISASGASGAAAGTMMLGGGYSTSQQFGGADRTRGFEEARQKVLERFGKAFHELVVSVAEHVRGLAGDVSKTSIDFFASPQSSELLQLLEGVEVRSMAYVPVLARYYRTREAAARSTRYVESLRSLAEFIPKVRDLAASTKGHLTHLRETALRMANLIEGAVRQMDGIFAELAEGKLEIAGDNSPLARCEGIDDPNASPGLTYIPDVRSDLMRAMDDLREAIKRATARKGLVDRFDKLNEYIEGGVKMNQEAVDLRLAEMRLTMTANVGQLPATVKRIGQNIMDFKLKAMTRFYATLLETEAFLAKRLKTIAMSAKLREDLYRTLGNWALASDTSAIVEDKLRDDARRLVDDLKLGTYFHHPAAAGTPAGAVEPVPIEEQSYIDRVVTDVQNYMVHNIHLRLAVNLIRIAEKALGSEFQAERMYKEMTNYIVASSIDICTAAEAMRPHTTAQLLSQRMLVGIEDDAHVIVLPSTGTVPVAAGVGTVGVSEHVATSRATAGTVGIYLRHALCEKRVEDVLFIRWVKAMAATLLLSLDQERSRQEIGEKAVLPGAERMLLGAGVADPIGLLTPPTVIPERTALYLGLPLVADIYREHFSWNESARDPEHAADAVEPQLIIHLARTSRFYNILELVRSEEYKSDARLSETHVTKIVSTVNEICDHFGGSAKDSAKLVERVFDAFFDEMNESAVTSTALEHSEMIEVEKSHREHDAFTGIVPEEQRVSHIPIGESRRKLQSKIFDAFKSVMVSTFGIINRAKVSEEGLARDWQLYIEKVSKKVESTPDAKRFAELVQAFRFKDDGIGDAQSIFLAFSELVVTPMYCLMACAEKFAWRASNLYMQIVRSLYAARVKLNYPIAAHRFDHIPAGAAGGPDDINSYLYSRVNPALAVGAAGALAIGAAGAPIAYPAPLPNYVVPGEMERIMRYINGVGGSRPYRATVISWYRCCVGHPLSKKEVEDAFRIAAQPLPTNAAPAGPDPRTNFRYVIAPFAAAGYGAYVPVPLTTDGGNVFPIANITAVYAQALVGYLPLLQRAEVTIGEYLLGVLTAVAAAAAAGAAVDANADTQAIIAMARVPDHTEEVFARYYTAAFDDGALNSDGANAGPTERLEHVMKRMATKEWIPVGGAVRHVNPMTLPGDSGDCGALYGEHTLPIESMRGLISKEGYLRIPCWPSIYKAMQLMLVPGAPIASFKSKVIAGHLRRVEMTADGMKALLQDGVAAVRETLGNFLKLAKRSDAEAYFQSVNLWDTTEFVEDIVKRVNAALAIVDPDSVSVLREYLPNAIVPSLSDNVHDWDVAFNALAPSWRINFRENCVLNNAVGKAHVAYQDNVVYTLHGGDRMRYIGKRLSPVNGRADDMTTTFTDESWSNLASSGGAFTPYIDRNGKMVPVQSCMPWSSEDQSVIEKGWTDEAASMEVIVGPAPNSSVLMRNYEQPSTTRVIGAVDVAALSQGGVIRDYGAAPPGTHIRSLHDAVDGSAWVAAALANNAAPAIGANSVTLASYSDPSVVMSGLYGRPSRDTKAETLNRLCAKAIHALTLRAEKPVLLYELAHTLASKSGFGKYLTPKNVGVPAKVGTLGYTFFPSCIGTPQQYEGGYLVQGASLHYVSRHGYDVYRNSPTAIVRVAAENQSNVIDVIKTLVNRRATDAMQTLYSRSTFRPDEQPTVFRAKVETMVAGLDVALRDVIGAFGGVPNLNVAWLGAVRDRIAGRGSLGIIGAIDRAFSDGTLVRDSSDILTAARTLIEDAVYTPSAVIGMVAASTVAAESVNEYVILPAIPASAALGHAQQPATSLVAAGNVIGSPVAAAAAGAAAAAATAQLVASLEATNESRAWLRPAYYVVGEQLVPAGRLYSFDLQVDGAALVNAARAAAALPGAAAAAAVLLNAGALAAGALHTLIQANGDNAHITAAEAAMIMQRLTDDLDHGRYKALIAQPFVELIRAYIASLLPGVTEPIATALSTLRGAGVQISDEPSDVAPDYQPGTFLYDTVASPIYWSMHGSIQKRLAELTPSEASSYMAAIPNLIRCFKNLNESVELDELLMTGSVGGQIQRGSNDGHTHVGSIAMTSTHRLDRNAVVAAIIALHHNAAPAPADVATLTIAMAGIGADPAVTGRCIAALRALVAVGAPGAGGAPAHARAIARALMAQAQDMDIAAAILHLVGVEPDRRFTTVTPDRIETIPAEMKSVIGAWVESLSTIYRVVREKFQMPLHAELTKGEFDRYFTAGRFDSIKLMTPLSVLAGTALADAKGPMFVSAFGEGGWEYGLAANATAWLSPIGLEREFGDYQTASTDSIPWTVSIAERLQRMLGKDSGKSMQAVVTLTARMFNVSNGFDLQALACHSPWSIHSIASSINHIRSIDLHVATMTQGADLVRLFAPHNDGTAPRYSLSDIASGAVAAGSHALGANELYAGAGSLTRGVGRVLDLGPFVAPQVGLGLAAIQAAGNGGAVIAAITADNRLVGGWSRINLPLTFASRAEIDDVKRLYATPTILRSTSENILEPNGLVSIPRRPAMFTPIVPGAAGGAAVGGWGGYDAAGNDNATQTKMWIRDLGFSIANLHSWRTASSPAMLSTMTALLRPVDPTKRDDGAATKYWRQIMAPHLDKHRLPLHVPGYRPDASGELAEFLRPKQWFDRRAKPKQLLEQQFGYVQPEADAAVTPLSGPVLEVMALAPPTTRWESSDYKARFQAGIFLHYKRNPISVPTIMRMIPFPSIYSFSEACDLYMHTAAWRKSLANGTSKAAARTNLLLDLPDLRGAHLSLGTGQRDDGTLVAAIGREVLNVDAKTLLEQPEKRSVTRVGQPAEVQTISEMLIRPDSALKNLIGVAASYGDTEPRVPLVPRDAANQLPCFPLFAVNMLFVDKLGLYMKDQIGTRAREVMYESSETVQRQKPASISLLE